MLKNNDKNNGDERRNYYRILNVQPDAPLEIIKNNYRTLLQKLRLHPDLGGENWNATVINEAYNTLRHPLKRAAYDKKLLKQFGVRSLSRGHLTTSTTKNMSGPVFKKDTFGNQRNFYRLFNIQPDSPNSIIKTTYLTLKKKKNFPKELLNEAYRILSNTEKRGLYDRLLTQYNHADALDKLNFGKKTRAAKSSISSTYLNKKPSPVSIDRNITNKSYYQPVITQYCAFCKTPHSQSPCRDTAPLCNECKSPLFPPSNTFLKQSRRDIVRLTQDSKIQFYTFWPGNKMIGTISDISPVGMQLVSSMKLNKDQIIKLDGEDFKAVGIVSYSNKDVSDEIQTTGIKFLTVNFNKSKGQFFSESA
jgi:curved DNA-binding protein CbpA